VVSLSRAPGTPWSSHTSSDGELTFLQKVPPPRPGRAAEMIHITGYAATSSPRRSTRGYNPPPRWAAGAKADGQRVVPAPAGRRGCAGAKADGQRVVPAPEGRRGCAGSMADGQRVVPAPEGRRGCAGATPDGQRVVPVPAGRRGCAGAKADGYASSLPRRGCGL
jgi:hypothetical protein